MAEISIDDKKLMAQLLFTQQKLDGRVIAKKIGVSEKTISRWKIEGNWDALRKRLGISKNVTLNALYDQLEELNENIRNRDEGARYPNAKEADTLIKLTASIRNLETDLAIADISMSGVRFIKFIQYRVPVEKVTEIADYWNDFLQEQIKVNG